MKHLLVILLLATIYNVPVRSFCVNNIHFDLINAVTSDRLLLSQDTSKKTVLLTTDTAGRQGYFNEHTAKYEVVDVNARPPEGLNEFRHWVGRNYYFPADAINAQVKGQIAVSFDVNKDGSLSNFKIIKNLGYGTGESLVNVLKKSKKWIPALKNGEPVKTSHTFPMNINLTN